MDSASKKAIVSMVFHATYGIYNVVLAAIAHSWWLLTLAVYYLILCTVRFVVLTTKRGESFIRKFTAPS